MNFDLFLKNGPNPASFCFISFFSHGKYSTNDKSVDGVLGTRTWGGKMVGTDKLLVAAVNGLGRLNVSFKILDEQSIRF